MGQLISGNDSVYLKLAKLKMCTRLTDSNQWLGNIAPQICVFV